ncbi:MAG: aspartate-semialdehyde dehydrogenase, partial [Candidatus Latescibacteria bacterium]|nr:aspartate-semialdehyde dehydrogenase [Candidatus Latescibacterota bacterium]
MSNNIRVGILGATGAVGQRFVELLQGHPWFTVTALAASERSAGKPYAEAATWRLDTPMPESVKGQVVQPCVPGLPCDLVFSGLDSSVAGPIEKAFASAGYAVISNSKNHRMDP